MASSKASLFDQIPFHQSRWSKARSHPARILILTYLHQNGITSFQTLCKLVPLARTTVSQHLRILRQAGLILLYEEYPHSYYQINTRLCKKFATLMKPVEDMFLRPEPPGHAAGSGDLSRKVKKG